MNQSPLGRLGKPTGATYYEVTMTGHKQLTTERETWNQLAAAVAQVLGLA